ncbi:hypothetical protein [Streptomyces sp. NPDC053720]|uniref:hypothetical protein n=1 Tax=Streptomyces sp. NPDC053720 TaxID=3154855 RepID=UPI00342F8DDA
MANVAHYVVVPEHGDYELYVFKWGATGLDISLLAGPDITISHFRASENAWGNWRDEILCEAAALVDLRHKVLLFFAWEGPTTTFLLHPAAREWHDHAWTGWDVRWAYSGLAELHEYLGLDPQAVSCPSQEVYPGWVLAPGDEWLSECGT